ncbi:Hypp598 [Branchiostoma lanceolatum]|uniref:Hypp598 protein n=1 Tax=Branchiostoma lanceolatum TaxID=7740 RepID=A0A8J9YJY7_BRALA|nr:Hypp598 [Branchiostoma lanceolatum]
MKASPGEEGNLTPSSSKERAVKWGTFFARLHLMKSHVTPYIHAMVYHVPRFLAKYKFIDNLSCESVEQDFEELAAAMKARPGAAGHLSPTAFQAKARRWGVSFRRVTFDEHVTPYMHAMIYHIPQFLRKYKYINDLSCESVEQEYENRDLFAILHNLDRKKAIMGPNAAQRSANLQEVQQREDAAEEDSEEEDRENVAEVDGETFEEDYEEEMFEEDDDE